MVNTPYMDAMGDVFPLKRRAEFEAGTQAGTLIYQKNCPVTVT